MSDVIRLVRAVLDSMADPVLILNADSHIVEANDAARQLFTLPQNGEPLAADFLPSDIVAWLNDAQRTINDWVKDDDHAYAPRLAALPIDALPPSYKLLILRDISQLKKLTHNQNEFIRIAAHDLRSPLTSIQGFANMLELGLVGELNEKQHEFVSKILSGVTQLTALVENIQDAGRFDPETGFYEILRAPCDLRELVAQVVEEHLLPAEKSALRLSASIEDDIPVLLLDSNMIERAVRNLVDNAIKYTPNGGSVVVTLSHDEHDVIIAVTDTGLGISSENQKRLFQRHVRIARQEHKRIKGSGLGLFIVRSVALQHGGDATVHSTEGQGSTFTIRLPMSPSGI